MSRKPTGEEGRSAQTKRRTKETEISVRILLDGTGEHSVETGIGFFDHMLASFAKHGLFDLEISASGDLGVDGHHTVEDVGICLGQALNQALGDRGGLGRFGEAVVPMDEALVMVCLDLSGRPYVAYDVDVPDQPLGEFLPGLAGEFFRALAFNARLTLHIRKLAGSDGHHILEAAFKALGRALARGVKPEPRAKGIPSLKGTLV
ncbi:MAG: imidazoleglycerol-phosphate dehydratase HisB [Firmicutes bacterium]|nr:imidazoleglycerol-phosphate dehydratase HisB [Bacillota bacterium]